MKNFNEMMKIVKNNLSACMGLLLLENIKSIYFDVLEIKFMG